MRAIDPLLVVCKAIDATAEKGISSWGQREGPPNAAQRAQGILDSSTMKTAYDVLKMGRLNQCASFSLVFRELSSCADEK